MKPLENVTEVPALFLKPGQERRLRTGHCWVYSNEIDTDRTPLRDFQPGEQIAVVDHRQHFIGFGYINPHSLICARLVSRDPQQTITASLLVHRMKIALGLRERLYSSPHYRAIYGESDGLPGLIIDRYGDYLVIQITTAGMERLRAEILQAALKVFRPLGAVLRNDSTIRHLEGLEPYVEVVHGSIPDLVQLQEAECQFQVSLLEGQKTGWFFDQASNRTAMLPFVKNKRVLDLFSYVGGWGIRSAVAGADKVICVDASQPALDAVGNNATLNQVPQQVETLRGDAFEVVKQLREAGEHFDVVLVDPPAFIKRRKDQQQGELAYRRINQAAMQLLARDGILISSSCSHHLSASTLLNLINQAGRHIDRSLQLLHTGGQGPDHPIHPAIVETAYLKSYFVRVLPTF